MPGAPGLDALLGNGAALRQTVELLEDVAHIEVFLHAPADGGLEVLLDLMLDDEDDAPKACAVGVEERKVDDRVAVIVHGLDLLEPAETAADAGGENDESGFHK